MKGSTYLNLREERLRPDNMVERIMQDFEEARLRADETQEEWPETEFDKLYPMVRASKLRLEDRFMEYTPRTLEQKKFKRVLTKAIKSGLLDFRKPIMDPCFEQDGYIGFKKDAKPAVECSAFWWDDRARKFMPDKNSRIGTKKEYVAFLGTLIKYLIEKEGYDVGEAWKMVCDDSHKLGHYINSQDAKGDYENTGSRKVGKFYDLANTCKIIRDDRIGIFLRAGGNYKMLSIASPLSRIVPIDKPYDYRITHVGWIVLDA